jgi:hypothetical protein
MKYLGHRSQAKRVALAKALEATFGEEADTGVYISTSGAAFTLRQGRAYRLL